MYQQTYHIHFVGIGGIGMSGIAELLLNLGYRVSGSDIALSDITSRLQAAGGIIHQGHAAEHVSGADVVVTSSAIGAQNPEVLAAQRLALPIIPRAEMLAELMRLKYSVAIAGAHGKTSTTSLVAEILSAGGLDPTVVIGGKLKSMGRNAFLGKGRYIVAEADESDGSFLKYSPSIAVVTNIDREHLDYYRDLEHIQSVFLSFIDRIPFYGLAVLCLDNEAIQNLIPHIHKRFITYGMTPQADYQARHLSFNGLQTRFELLHGDQSLGPIRLNLPGTHNVYNAMAAIAVGRELNVSMAVIRDALETFQGVQRRLEIKGTRDGVLVVDDYGHHPTEIRHTLQALESSWPERRKVIVFQPHRYSRTQALFDDFARAFYQSDVLLVLPIYAAGEKVLEDVSGLALSAAIGSHGHRDVSYLESIDAALDYLTTLLKPDDVLLTLGAGDVWKVGEGFLSKEEGVRRKE